MAAGIKRFGFCKMDSQFYILPALGVTRAGGHYSLAFGWLCFGGYVAIHHRK